MIDACPGNPICNGHGYCPEGRKICVCLHGFTGHGCENSPEPIAMDEIVKALKERNGNNLIHKVSIIFKKTFFIFFHAIDFKTDTIYEFPSSELLKKPQYFGIIANF